ncbi:hypothetical protein Bbelb_065330 [Branchiostoma belcheri]|nr:hypothetical protein Bbelb_065330 [Branchiostoma belcheri]
MPVTRSGSQQGRGRGGRALGRGGPTQRGGRGGRGRGGPTTDQPEDIANLRTELQRLQAANELLSKELESRPPAPQGAPTLPTTTQFGPTPPALPPAQLDGPANALAGAILGNPTHPAQTVNTNPTDPPTPAANTSRLGAHVPLDNGVSAALKDKIWRDVFIDLKQLLPSASTDTRALYTVALSDTDGPPTLTLANRAVSSKQPLSLDRWLDAFAIFHYIYLQRHPSSSSQLISYQSLVRSLAAKGADWQTYDTQFRQYRQAFPAAPWDTPQMQLYVNALTGSKPSTVPLTSRRTQSQSTPKQVPKGSPPPALPTPVRASALHRYLHGYPESDKQYVIKGFTSGFPLEYFGPRYVTALSLPQQSGSPYNPVISEKLQQELQSGRIAGPFKFPPFHNLFLSPLYAVPKKTPGKFRLIHDLSSPPPGASVNDGIPRELSSVTYSSIDTAIKHIKTLGPGCYLAKTDIQSAFRLIPVHPDDHHLLGFTYNGEFYYDRCLPMGSSISCAIFESLSTALEWICRKKLNIPFPTHILDDFLFANRSYHLCDRDLSAFSNMCVEVGIPLADDKTFSPDTVMTFLGIELDTIAMEARIPPDKLHKGRDQLFAFLSASSATLKQIQSLIGLLNHVCQVVLPGRAFLRRLIDLTKSQSSSRTLIHISDNVRQDLRMWHDFLTSFNGKSFFLEDSFTFDSTLHLFTDAAASLGFGAVFQTAWVYGAWPPSFNNINITILEFYPIVLSLHIWGRLWTNKRILFHTDNEALVHVINKQTSRNPAIMPLLRHFVLICLEHNVLCRATHIPDRPLPPHIPSHGAMPNSGTLPSTAVVLNKVANDLLMTSLAPSTLRAYRSAWQQLRQFTFQLVGRDLTMPPISVPLLSQFIASLHQRQIAPASISSKLSAISFIHKLFDLPDPTQSFVIQKLMQAIRKFRVPDDRLPISPFILKSLVDSLQNTTATHYDQALFKAMYLFTYYSMARIGEVAVTSGPQHTLQLSNISLFPSRQTSGPSIIATFQSFKHNSSGRPSSISIQSQPGSRYCPVASLQDYLKLRGNCAGCLFLRSNGRPVSADLFARTLKTSLEHLGLDTHKITPHSFRIGAATWAAMQGVPDSLLRSLGRWSSDAFKHYIRL